jgi:hypothetical protein
MDSKQIYKLLIFALFITANSVSQTWQSSKVYYRNNKLQYAADSEQNVIPDFSYAGYKRGEAAIPFIPVIKTIYPVSGDNTQNIQSALDEVGALSGGTDGFIGALYLAPGVYNVWGSIYVKYSGIVLRGAGNGEDSTVNTIIYGRGDSTHQRNLIIAGGDKSSLWKDSVSGTKTNITTQFVPTGSRIFEVASASKYAVGDNIIIYHPCTDAWLQAVNYGGTHDTILWQVGEEPIVYNRRITAINGNQITIDAPVFNPLNKSLSQAYIYKYGRANLKTNIGIENIRIDIETAGGTDENHIWSAIELNQLEDSWVRNCTMLHFGQSGVITCTADRVTVDNCSALDPVSIITGERRYNFNTYTASQLILFSNCLATNGRHHFVSNGHSFASGNVFYNCKSIGIYNSSEGHRRWSQGFLYDNIVDSAPNITSYVLGLYNRGNYGTAHGWAITNSVVWNCRVSNTDIIIQKPPTGQNYAIGCFARKVSGATPPAPFQEAAGFIEGTNKDSLNPQSLYLAQLKERLGTSSIAQTKTKGIAPENIQIIGAYPNPFNPATSVEYELATKESVNVIIYDSLGKEVQKLFGGIESSGKHKIVWNPSSANLPSGIYFCRISNELSFVMVKLLFLK